MIAQDEKEWYKKIINLGYTNTPKIYDYNPLTMQMVNGKNVFAYNYLTNGFKKALLNKIVNSLEDLHNIAAPIAVNINDCESTYITKTFDRLSKIKNLVPFAQDKYITINGKKCINIFAIKDKIVSDIHNMYPSKFFVIHGDCTFHNIMIETQNVRPILIDPRGYFGQTKIYGDIDYDWAKLYYSLVGDYDQFNQKNFSLEIKEKEVELEIVSNNWNALEEYFFQITKADKKKIKLLHSLIWLSLTTYVWEDYDAICGAFYKGLLELEEYLSYDK